jgi:hypothetical protein
VTIAGFVIHKPLSKVPENTMKFIVGTLLTSFGIFWGAEGAGVQWPHQDLSLLPIIGFVLGICFALIEVLKARKAKNYSLRSPKIPTFTAPTKSASPIVRWIGGFLFFWYDFIIGDDWRVAVAMVVALFSTHALGSHSWWVMPCVVAGTLIFTLLEASAAAPSDTSR